MGRKLWQVWLLGLAAAGAAGGCHRSAVREKAPPDPLLISKPPVAGKPTSFESRRTAQADLVPPPLPGAGPGSTAVAAGTDEPAPVRLLGLKRAPDEGK
jgi:hypothetical protein